MESSKESSNRSRKWKFYHNPSAIVLISFLTLLTASTVALTISLYSAGFEIGLIDILFIATSASTVTGLWPSSIALADFPRQAQWIILAIIPLAGLGAMTAFTFLLVFVRWKWKEVMQQILGSKKISRVGPILRDIVVYSVLFQVIGFLVYFSQWKDLYSLEDALFYSLFHSVSAFNNAGFSLFRDSFLQFQSNPIINANSIFLFIAGGLGFPVWATIRIRIWEIFLHRKRSRVDIYSKIMLLGTFLLIASGSLAFFFLEAPKMEWNPQEAFWISLFQSVTARTAGFSTIDIGSLSDGTLLVLAGLMFIGAGPLSTSGGVKIVTFFLTLIPVWTIFKKKASIIVWKRTIPQEDVLKSTTVFVTSIIAVAGATFLLVISENLDLLDILFEVSSAFGTVGLSTGITASLSTFGKILIMLIMAFGRLGPLTLIYLLSRRTPPPKIDYPEEESIIIG